MTLLGACGGGSPTATPAKSGPPSSWAPVATTPAALPAALASFAGSWYTHEQPLTIDNTGHGHIEYTDFSRCPSCSLADAPRSTVDFTLTSVSNNMANGSITAATNTQHYPVGAPVMATLVPGMPKGTFLQLTIGGGEYRNYCNDTSLGECGA
jgi:hypothetical protein